MPIPPDWSQNFTAFVTEWKRKSDSGEYVGYEYLGDNPFERFVVVEKAESWDSFLRWIDELDGCWCFRGQREASWGLDTSLDRGVRREKFSPHSSSLYHLNRKTEMKGLLYRFQQYAHTYLPHVPATDDLSSWYSLMQHYCAPTPLLDWTESPYVGLYFAIENSASGSHCAVWAIDSDWLEKRGREVLQQKEIKLALVEQRAVKSSSADTEHTNRLLRETEAPLVLRINPAMSNPRLFAQQGLFLCKLIEQASVGQLLMTMVMYPTLTERPVIRKLEVGGDLRIKFLKRLRAMNIHRASLFPGLDGLGTSLKLDLELKDSDS
jgi:FRG domain-containing protein